MKTAGPLLSLALILIISGFATYASGRWVIDLHSPTPAGEVARADMQKGTVRGQLAPYGLLSMSTVIFLWSSKLAIETALVWKRRR